MKKFAGPNIFERRSFCRWEAKARLLNERFRRQQVAKDNVRAN